MVELKKIAEQLINLSVKEVNELTKILKEEHGIEPAAVSMAVAPATDGAEGANEEEKNEFDVVMNSPGQSKLAVIKLVKELTGLGLKESKEKVDSAPTAIKEKVSKDETETVKKQLEEAGAENRIKIGIY